MPEFISRRSFVQGSLAGSAAVAVGPTTPASARNTGVLVVGAGMSGLSTAYHLRKLGIGAIVLEARQRIGGRIWTDSTSLGATIDLGASFIHHAEDSPLTPFCQDHGIATTLTPLSSIEMFLANHVKVPKTEVDGAVALFVVVLAALQALAADRKDKSLPDIRLSAALVIVFAGMPPLTDRQKTLFEISKCWFIRAATGAEPENISLYNTMAYFSAGAADRAFPKGYRQVLDVLAEHIDVRLGHVVRTIDYRTKGVQVVTNRGVFTAARVVVTLPIGVLQSNAVQFLPALPLNKRAAIARARLGVVNKLFLQFPERFWDNNTILLMRSPDAQLRWPVFLNFGKVVGPPILMAFNSGSAGLATESVPLNGLVTQARQALQTMFAKAIPEPTAVVRSSWASDPFARGSYPFFPIGSQANDRDEIAKSVSSRLFFAGDGTRNGDAEARGAFLSGLRAANEIAGRTP